jgi:hypothetical protein
MLNKDRPTEVSLLEQIFSWPGSNIDRFKASFYRTSSRPPNVSASLPRYVCGLRPTSELLFGAERACRLRLAQSTAQLGVRLRYLETYTDRSGSDLTPMRSRARTGVDS